MERLGGQPSLELGVKVVRVAGLDPADHQLERRGGGGGGTLFVRYYVPAGDGRRRLRVDTREVPCGGGDLSWGELARFERWSSSSAGAGATGSAYGVAATPGAGSIAFELRWRPRPSSSSGLAALLGAGARRRASRLLARAELAWPDEDAAAAEGRWLTLSPAGSERMGECKAPRLLVEVSTAVRAVVAGGGGGQAKRARKPAGANECCGAGERCGQCGFVGNEENMFLAATFDQ